MSDSFASYTSHLEGGKKENLPGLAVIPAKGPHFNSISSPVVDCKLISVRRQHPPLFRFCSSMKITYELSSLLLQETSAKLYYLL